MLFKVYEAIFEIFLNRAGLLNKQARGCAGETELRPWYCSFSSISEGFPVQLAYGLCSPHDETCFGGPHEGARRGVEPEFSMGSGQRSNGLIMQSATIKSTPWSHRKTT